MNEKKSLMDLIKSAETKIYMSDLPEGRYTAKYRGIKEVPEDKVNGTRPFAVLLYSVQYSGQEVEVTDFLTHQDIPDEEQMEKMGQKFSRIQKILFGSLNMSPFETHSEMLGMDINIWIVKSMDEKGVTHSNVRYAEPPQKTALDFLSKKAGV